MSNKLGIFIDINSIGWALTDPKTNELIDLGVHIFSPGCENFGAGRREVSKKYSRRLIRMRRVRYARIRSRKFYLLRILIQHKMFPLSMDKLMLWKKTKQFPHQELEEWIKLNPYQLIKKGLNDKISLCEFGRIFYQISRHRGYRFEERNSKLIDSVLSRGVPAEGKVGYLQIQKEMTNKTLGEYLYDLEIKQVTLHE